MSGAANSYPYPVRCCVSVCMWGGDQCSSSHCMGYIIVHHMAACTGSRQMGSIPHRLSKKQEEPDLHGTLPLPPPPPFPHFPLHITHLPPVSHLRSRFAPWWCLTTPDLAMQEQFIHGEQRGLLLTLVPFDFQTVLSHYPEGSISSFPRSAGEFRTLNPGM